LDLAQRIYNTTQVKYKNGVGSSLETSTAEQQLYQSQFNVRQAQYDLIVAQRTLQTALGK
jgi:outer membrane protein TolC